MTSVPKQPSRRWLSRSAVLYRYFAGDAAERYNLDFSEQAALQAYLLESGKQGNLAANLFEPGRNGFLYGKSMMDLMVEEWRDGCARNLSRRWELRKDLEDDPVVLAWFDRLSWEIFEPVRSKYTPDWLLSINDLAAKWRSES